MLFTKNYYNYKSIGRLKVRRGKKIYHENINQRKAGVTILMSDKVHFRIKKNHHNQRETLYDDKRVQIPRRNSIVKVYAPNNRIAIYAKTILLKMKGEIDKFTIIVGTSTSFSK